MADGPTLVDPSIQLSIHSCFNKQRLNKVPQSRHTTESNNSSPLGTVSLCFRENSRCRCRFSLTSPWLKWKLPLPSKGEKTARGKVSSQKSRPSCLESAADLAVSCFTKELFSFHAEARWNFTPSVPLLGSLKLANGEWKWGNKALENEIHEAWSQSGNKYFCLNRCQRQNRLKVEVISQVQ